MRHLFERMDAGQYDPWLVVGFVLLCALVAFIASRAKR
jgi:hypothetical protein